MSVTLILIKNVPEISAMMEVKNLRSRQMLKISMTMVQSYQVQTPLMMMIMFHL